MLALVVVAVGAVVVILLAVGSRKEPSRMPERFVATKLPASPAAGDARVGRGRRLAGALVESKSALRLFRSAVLPPESV